MYNMNNDIIDINNFHKLNVCSFDVRLMQSANYKKKIDELINFIQLSNIDVICLQGIHDTKLLKCIIKKILLSNTNHPNENNFYTFPTLDVSQLHLDTDNMADNYSNVLRVTWSKSNDQDLTNIDCLIVSKFRIITSSKVEVKWDNITENRFAYISNIDFNGILLSIYNVSFLNDFVGISNIPIRKFQIRQLKKIIDANTECIDRDKKFYEMVNNKNIHIISCLANITEMLNNDINNEYLYFIRTIKCIDVYRYIQTVKRNCPKNKKDATTLCGLRMNYILLYCNDDKLNDILNQQENIAYKIENIIFNNNKIIIINSIINRTLTYYDDYPIISSFLVEKVLQKNQSGSQLEDDEVVVEIGD